jgi:ribosome-associated protein
MGVWRGIAANERKRPSLTINSRNGIGLTATQLKTLIEQALDDNKAEDIETIDLSGLSPLADYMIIANGRSSRQVVGLAGKIKEKLAEYGIKAKTEGTAQGDWVIVDCLDIIVHLFRPEVREFYAIEKMWKMDPMTGMNLSTPKQKQTILV